MAKNDGRIEVTKFPIPDSTKTITVFVHRGTGTFSADHDDDTITNDTLDGLLNALARRFKRAKAKVDIPATVWKSDLKDRAYSWRAKDTPDELVDVTIVGQNERTSDLLLRGADGKAVTLGRYSSVIYRRMTPAQKKKLMELKAAYDKAQAAHREYEVSMKIDRRVDVDAKIKAAAAAAEAAG